MIPTLNSVTAGGGLTLPDFVSLAKRHGFSGVEFSIEAAAAIADENGFEAVAAIFDEATVLPAVFGLPTQWRQDEATFEAGLEQLPRLAKLAQDLGCSRCTTWVLPDSGENVQEYSSRSLARFQRIGEALEEQGVRLGLEFIGPLHLRQNAENVWFYDIPGALQVIDEIERGPKLENVGLLVDCWHWYTSGGTMMDLASIPVEKIVHVHINDAPEIPVEEQVDNVRLLPGASGVIDIMGFLGTLNALGYDGPLAVETFSEVLNQLEPDEAAARAAVAVSDVLIAANITPVRLV